MLKITFIINIFFLCSLCFAHERQSADLYLSLMDNKKIKIEVKEFKTDKEIFFNQIKIVSRKDNILLDEFLLSRENNIINIPDEDYFVLAKIGNTMVNKNGILSKNDLNNSIGFLTFFIVINIMLFILSLIVFNMRINKNDKIKYKPT